MSLKRPSTPTPLEPSSVAKKGRSDHAVKKVPLPINTAGINTAGINTAGRIEQSAPTVAVTPVAASHHMTLAAPATISRRPDVFPFLLLPGELRNKIYEYALTNHHQAVLRHRPKIAVLRPRNFDSRRPWYGLTAVCRKIREEFRTLYLQKQHYGIEYADATAYLETFYPEGVAGDSSRTGNLTFAIPTWVSRQEKKDGVDLRLLLELWANAWSLSTGFGRYVADGLNAYMDGEAKDLYRLLGRKVLRDRSVTLMNQPWKNILKTRQLAACYVYRDDQGPRRPWIHVVFKAEFREGWMTGVPQIPSATWIERHGFDRMEHFILKVSAAYPTVPMRGAARMKYVPGPDNDAAPIRFRLKKGDGRFALR